LRITTTQQLVDLLDGLFADRADWTSRAGGDHWAEVLSREEVVPALVDFQAAVPRLRPAVR
jgi:hypothetical protein